LHQRRLYPSFYVPPWTSLVLTSAISFTLFVKLFSHISLADRVVVSTPLAVTADHLRALLLFLLPQLVLQVVVALLVLPKFHCLLSRLVVLAFYFLSCNHWSRSWITQAFSTPCCLRLTMTKAGGERGKPRAFA